MSNLQHTCMTETTTTKKRNNKKLEIRVQNCFSIEQFTTKEGNFHEQFNLSSN